MSKRNVLLIYVLCIPFFMYASSVKKFGAKGNGKTLDTKSIQAAIDAVSKQGGGEVFFPAGDYLTGTLFLKDNVTLNLSNGATILGSTDLKDYPVTPSGYVSHINRYTNRYLIYAEGVKNIGITGSGTIDGQGSLSNFPADLNDPLLSIILRPYILRVVSCENVKVTGITMKNSPAWMQHYLNCTNIYIEGLTIYNHGNYNNDGIDIDNCRAVQIRSCNIDTDDDGICFKTTNDTGRCEDIVVSDNLIASNCNAVKFGTETNGGFYNVSISNCTFIRPQEGTIYDRPHRALGGIAISTVDGATIDGITINNISMNGIMTPIFIRLANRGRNYYDGGPSQQPGKIRNISISNVIATTWGLVPSSITGIEGHVVENVSLSNIRIITPGEGSMENAQRRNLTDREKEYPETLIFHDAPAYGLFVQNVKGLTLDNIYLESKKADFRSAIYCEKAENITLNHFTISNPYLETPLVTLHNVQNVSLTNNLPVYNNKTLLSIEGAQSDKIYFSESDLSRYSTPVIYKYGALPVSGKAATASTTGKSKIRVLMAGDSTMQDVDHNRSIDWGWGQVLPRFFDNTIEVRNFAKGGRSTRTFTEEGRWKSLLEEAGDGDYVFIQFGHNDGAVDKKERYTPLNRYRSYLIQYVNEARAKGATPILVTPVSRRKFNKGVLVSSHGEYPAIVKEVAREMNVPLIDLQEKSEKLITAYGEEKSKELFIHVEPGINRLAPEGKSDNTHFSEPGAMQIAKLITEGIRELKIEPLTNALIVK